MVEKKLVVMTLGLPCSGKSSWAEKNIPDDYITVSADAIKESYPSYHPEFNAHLHQDSVKQAREDLFYHIKNFQNIFFDSGSINNKYSKNICARIKTQYPEYDIKLVWIKTPYEVCLERNAVRERKVPDHSITDKAAIEVANFHKLWPYATFVEVVDYFKNQHVFFDMDGVLAAQTTLPIINGEIDFVNGEIHKWQRPVEPMIQLSEILQQTRNVYILSASANSFCNEQKLAWLEEYAPWINKDKIFFVNQGKHKAEMLENLVRKFKLPKNEVVLIDDFHATLYDVKRRGMNAMHVSEALVYDWMDSSINY